MNQGWIKLPRSIQNQPWWSDPEIIKLYIHLHMMAAVDPYTTMWEGRPFTVQKGQLITGRKRLADSLNLSKSKVERGLQMLQNCSQIGQQTSRTSRLITINYEGLDVSTGQPSDTNRTPIGPKSDTYLKNKNKNIIRKEDVDVGATPPPPTYWYGLFNQLNADQVNRDLVMKTYRMSADQFTHQLKQFFREKEVNQKTWENFSDCKSNFFYWLKVQGDRVREPLPIADQASIKADIDDFYNSRMSPIDRIGQHSK